MSEEQKIILRDYRNHRVPKSILDATSKDLCRPPSLFKLQPQQRFLEEFMGPSGDRKTRGMLVFHRIGSGKTCTAIRIGEAWKAKRKIIVVLPAFLKSNFYQELMGSCGGYKSMEEVDDIYKILSYQKFIEKLPRISLEKTVLIIDEVQNMISEDGVFYNKLLRKVERSPSDFRIVLLSATPIFDKPVEIGLAMNLLPLKQKFPVGSDFDDLFIKETDDGTLRMTNIDTFKKLVRGVVSFYPGMPEKAFPKREVTIVKCTMSDFQYKSYTAALRQSGLLSTADSIRGRMILRLPTSFFLGVRMISNVAFPNQEGNESGFESWRGVHLRKDRVKKYSVKFHKILKHITRSPKGTKIFVYSSFAQYGGIISLATLLEYNGYTCYTGKTPLNDQKLKKGFGVWIGGQPVSYRDRIRDAFNDPNSGLDILLGSPSIREGVSLKRVEQIHVLEPYWNMSRLEQVVGRGSRFCSHQDLPRSRRLVKIFIYIGVRPDESSHKNKERILEKYSIDRYILSLALKKKTLISDFEQVLKETSVDCLLNEVLTPGIVCS